MDHGIEKSHRFMPCCSSHCHHQQRQRSDLHNHPNPLVRLIADWKKKDWVLCFKHIFRESNRVADCLARIGGEIEPVLRFWNMPPQEVARILIEDERGVALPRVTVI
ncbi:uncharacterized protein DS421_19g651970 [Arachis hypogaea]|uniref:RNase H type-1 domain-containing protein n=1 Tax=Arachis hypogaea TaxID=3818 RepID=A0A6B9V7Z4_ARAHY|nr:uncharacterized protein DS421_19g651970 [Arachis hypogaea]